jgi:hypothetical protein
MERAAWVPRWYALDQPLAVGLTGEFSFWRVAPEEDPGVEAPSRAPAPRSPTHQTPRFVRQATRLRIATAPTGGRRRRRTARELRTVAVRSLVSTPGAAAIGAGSR